MDNEDILRWLQICDLAKQWPGLKPIHDAAMAKLIEAAALPAHKPPEQPKPIYKGT